MASHNPMNLGVRSAGANRVRIVTLTRDNPMTSAIPQGASTPPGSSDSGCICPSVCLSDWDKRKTPAARCCCTIRCNERLDVERRGQDSNLRTPLQGHGFSKPALSATQPPLLKPFQVSGYVCFRRMALLLQ